ncbi:hypothetical protein IQ274_32275 [Nostoc sp. LEGE 12447]|uniref:hypothetical protein n=1 Tax=Nostoc sp. LEGE 12447 TaxID=1828640 RepID=UPI001883993C|nr:hypothetical protein [Nostoc sp. LEGE 12447]MBE9002735.1 hypothetical protein [Nostoc sp. LEGE 12447]
MQLLPNTTTIHVKVPSSNESFFIPPGEALYDPETGYIHFLKSTDNKNPMLLQLLPRKIQQTHRNRSIAKVMTTLISVFGVNINELVDFLFDEGIERAGPVLADVISSVTAKEELGYYNMQTKELALDFPIRISL